MSSFPLPDPNPPMPPFEYLMADVGIRLGMIVMMLLILWLLPPDILALKIQYREWRRHLRIRKV
jgi:hypothetical protein